MEWNVFQRKIMRNDDNHYEAYDNLVTEWYRPERAFMKFNYKRFLQFKAKLGLVNLGRDEHFEIENV